jgi:hypothetical protein
MFAYCTSSHLRKQLAIVFHSQYQYHQTIHQLVHVPISKVGYLSKLGHYYKNWKNRYFTLLYGELTYYRVVDRFPLLAKLRRSSSRKSSTSSFASGNSSTLQASLLKDGISFDATSNDFPNNTDEEATASAFEENTPLILSKNQTLKGKILLRGASVKILHVKDKKTNTVSRNIHRMTISLPLEIEGVLLEGGNDVKQSIAIEFPDPNRFDESNQSITSKYELILEAKTRRELEGWYEALIDHIRYANLYL